MFQCKTEMSCLRRDWASQSDSFKARLQIRQATDVLYFIMPPSPYVFYPAPKKIRFVISLVTQISAAMGYQGHGDWWVTGRWCSLRTTISPRRFSSLDLNSELPCLKHEQFYSFPKCYLLWHSSRFIFHKMFLDTSVRLKMYHCHCTRYKIYQTSRRS